MLRTDFSQFRDRIRVTWYICQNNTEELRQYLQEVELDAQNETDGYVSNYICEYLFGYALMKHQFDCARIVYDWWCQLHHAHFVSLWIKLEQYIFHPSVSSDDVVLFLVNEINVIPTSTDFESMCSNKRVRLLRELLPRYAKKVSIDCYYMCVKQYVTPPPPPPPPPEAPKERTRSKEVWSTKRGIPICYKPKPPKPYTEIQAQTMECLRLLWQYAPLHEIVKVNTYLVSYDSLIQKVAQLCPYIIETFDANTDGMFWYFFVHSCYLVGQPMISNEQQRCAENGTKVCEEFVRAFETITATYNTINEIRQAKFDALLQHSTLSHDVLSRCCARLC